MKRLTRSAFSLLAMALFSLGATLLIAQGNSRGKADAHIGAAHVSIDYGRPMLKGRDPLSMIKPGQVWRLGASAPTTIESDQDLLIGNTRVPKGRHILLAQMLEPGKWVLLVSSKAANEYDPSAKIAETPMKVESVQDAVEAMTIELSSNRRVGELKVAWGTSRLTTTFSVAE